MTAQQRERPYIGIGIIVIRDGKVLLGERISSHGSGTLQIVGGHLEFGQSFEEATRQEVQEETGLENIKIKGVVSIGNDVAYNKHYVSIGILVESPTGDPYDAEPDKSRNWQWYDLEKLPENIFLPSKKVLTNWLQGKIYTDNTNPEQ